MYELKIHGDFYIFLLHKFLDYLGAKDSVDSSKGEVLKPTTLREDINIPINIGDTIMMGRFKNGF